MLLQVEEEIRVKADADAKAAVEEFNRKRREYRISQGLEPEVTKMERMKLMAEQQRRVQRVGTKWP